MRARRPRAVKYGAATEMHRGYNSSLESRRDKNARILERRTDAAAGSFVAWKILPRSARILVQGDPFPSIIHSYAGNRTRDTASRRRAFCFCLSLVLFVLFVERIFEFLLASHESRIRVAHSHYR